jgi:hypothetical protein
MHARPDDQGDAITSQISFLIDETVESGDLLPVLAKLLIDLAEREEAKQEDIQGT